MYLIFHILAFIYILLQNCLLSIYVTTLFQSLDIHTSPPPKAISNISAHQLTSAILEVRRTAELYDRAYPPSCPPPRTPSRHSSLLAADGQAETDRSILVGADAACAPF